MNEVVWTGWNEGLRKVTLDLLLHQKGGLPLKQAKQTVDDLLAGHTVRVVLANTALAHAIATEAQALGAVCFVPAQTDRVVAAR